MPLHTLLRWAVAATAWVCVCTAQTTSLTSAAIKAEFDNCLTLGGKRVWPSDTATWGTTSATWPNPTAYTVVTYAYCPTNTRVQISVNGDTSVVDQAAALSYCVTQAAAGNPCYSLQFHNGNGADRATQSTNKGTANRKWRACHTGPSTYDATNGAQSYSAYNMMCEMPTTQAPADTTHLVTTTVVATAPAPESTTPNPDSDCEADWVDAGTSWRDLCFPYSCGDSRYHYKVYNVFTAPTGQGAACLYEDGFEEQTSCNLPACNTNCVGAWGAWGTCPVTCLANAQDTTQQTRTFVVTTPQENAGTACSFSNGATSTKLCDAPLCPINCVGAWGAWGVFDSFGQVTPSGSCPATCGSYKWSREFTITTVSQGTGSACVAVDQAAEEVDCAPNACPVDCVGAAVVAGSCTVTCGGGTLKYRFDVSVAAKNGGVECALANGATYDVSCNTNVCPVDCVGAWGAWGTCSQTCGGGYYTRTFSVTSAAMQGGADCIVSDGTLAADNCNTAPCPVNCVGAWGTWGACPVTCGDGAKLRTFSVSQAAQLGGVACDRSDGETEALSGCAPDPCPVDCVGSWTAFSPCSVTCELGSTSRSFVVTVPASSGGVECSYAHGTGEVETCTPTDSSGQAVVCPVTCQGSWSAWTSCSLTCGVGSQSKTFTVAVAQAGSGEHCEADHGETLTASCNTGACPVNCIGAWTQWGTCSVTCGSGVEARKYGIVVAAANGGTACANSATTTETRTCTKDTCPISCVGSWTSWTTCSTSCASGTNTRTYTITTAAQYGGTACSTADNTVSSQTCNLGSCPIDCSGAWQAWGTCTTTCGGGTKQRSYKVNVNAFFGGAACAYTTGALDSTACGTTGCPVACVGVWGSWGTCSKTCGTGGQSRTFAVTTANSNGGAACTSVNGAVDNTGICNTNSCPRNCVGDWSAWSDCTVTCADGTRSRTYTVTTSALNGGTSCSTTPFSVESQTCSNSPCAVHCVGQWGQWSSCTKTCGTGETTRTFAVTTADNYGGDTCVANDGEVENVACSTSSCPVNCVGAWQTWGMCDKTCGTGSRIHTYLQSVEVSNGGVACTTANFTIESEACSTTGCPVDCVGSWAAWTDCSTSCGAGINTRTFLHSTSAANGGVACPTAVNTVGQQACNLLDCPVDCQGAWGEWDACSLTCTGSDGKLGSTLRRFIVTVPTAFGGESCEILGALSPTVSVTAVINASEEVVDSTACNTAACPIDCVGAWSLWSACSVTCGAGTISRDFTVQTPAANGGTACVSTDGFRSTDTCSNSACPVHCVGAWSQWTTCTKTCGSGTTTRTFAVTTAASSGGNACVSTSGAVESVSCSASSCPVDCVGVWQAWGTCDKTCGSGSRIRTYVHPVKVSNGGVACTTAQFSTESQTCSTTSCPVNCVGAWTTWTSCSMSCGAGINTRSFVHSTSAANGGVACTTASNTIEQQACNLLTCPVDCVGSWKEWGDCSLSCVSADGALGAKLRQFIVTTEASFGGLACSYANDDGDSAECNTQPCPVNCAAHWTEWGDCSRSCNGGDSLRQFVVDQFPKNGGMACEYEDATEEILDCNSDACPANCVGSWSEWHTCSKSCGVGSQSRYYNHESASSNGGAECDFDDDHETSRSCNSDPCPIDCVGAWTEWTDCSHTCSDGMNTRSFLHATTAAFGGADCAVAHSTSDMRSCFLVDCPVDCDGAWGQWSDCSLSCDNGDGTLGEAVRSFKVTVEAAFGGLACEPFVGGNGVGPTQFLDNRTCSTQACPVDCDGAWQEWGACSQSCLDDRSQGTKLRNFLVSVPAAHGGAECSFAVDDQDSAACNTHPCPVDCVADWTQWGECSLTCNTGSQSRHYFVDTFSAYGGVICDYDSNMTADARECNSDPCPLDCLGSWTEWTECGLSCGIGFQSRTFNHDRLSEFGGAECELEHDHDVNRSCNTHSCPVDCVGAWTEWTDCSRTCSDGFSTRTFLYSTDAAFGGADCAEADEADELQVCFLTDCPVNCEGAWGQWGDCSLSCDNGNGTVGETVRRYEVAVDAAFGGLACEPFGPDGSGVAVTDASQEVLDFRACSTSACPIDCVGTWEEWGACSESCLDNRAQGAKQRTFFVSVPAAQGGSECNFAPNDQDSAACNTQPCPVDCVADWTEWGACSLTCNTGSESRHYLVAAFPEYGGMVCDFDNNMTADERECNSQACPLDCVGSWTEWTECGLTCGVGSQARTFVHDRQSAFGGVECELEHDHNVSRSCSTHSCPVDCVGAWTEWTDCSHTCSDGINTRSFLYSTNAAFGGVECAEADNAGDVRACFLLECPVDCEGTWGQWGDCSLSCDNGNGTVGGSVRRYEVDIDAAFGGLACEPFGPGDSGVAVVDASHEVLDYRNCNTGACPIDCVGAWNPWSDCSATCDNGTVQRDYAVVSYEQHGGAACDFALGSTDTLPCMLRVCRVDCVGAWQEWGACSESCLDDQAQGTKLRNFLVTAPAEFGGSLCSSEDGDQDSAACETDPCPADCVADWTEWGECSLTCSTGSQARYYFIDTFSAYGGVVCDFEHNMTADVRECNPDPCPLDCIGSWTDWTECSLTCGMGLQSRTFVHDRLSAFGGVECELEHDHDVNRSCNTYSCPVDCVGSWLSWGACSATCDSATRARSFHVDSALFFGGADCLAAAGDQETQACDLIPCPVDCEGDWTAWGACSTTCGGGATSRTFVVSMPEAHGGAICDIDHLVSEAQACETSPCPLDCQGVWSTWADCSRTCNGGQEHRTFQVTLVALNGGAGCDWSNLMVDERVCNSDGCPGCPDAQACNYQSFARVDDGSCTYPDAGRDCSGACVVEHDTCGECGGDNSTCSGCTAAEACNREAAALVDDGSCTFARPNYNCFDRCTAARDCAGACAGPAELDVCGVCAGGNVSCTGCLDAAACNYDAAALVDSFQCSYPADDTVDCFGHCVVDVDCLGTCGGSAMRDACGVCGGDSSSCAGCPDKAACNYATALVADLSLCRYPKTDRDCNGQCMVARDCTGACGGAAVRDSCNVCQGSGLSCLEGYCPSALDHVDCAGTCNGTATEDACGVCQGDSTSCAVCGDPAGCNFVDGAPVSDSSICTYPPSSRDCSGQCIAALDCLGVCAGAATKDACGVCKGDNSSCSGCKTEGACNIMASALFAAPETCLFPVSTSVDCAGRCVVDRDCAGVCGGPSVEDACGVCNGDDSSCAGCTDASACNFDATALVADPAACTFPSPTEACDGTCLAEVDCAGECGGSRAVDECGVCGGNNSDCFVAFGAEHMLSAIERGEAVADLQARFAALVAKQQDSAVAGVQVGSMQVVNFHGTFDSVVPRTVGTATMVVCGLPAAAVDMSAARALAESLAWGFHAGTADVASWERDTSGRCSTASVELTVDVMASDVICSGQGNAVADGYSAVLGGALNTVRGNWSVVHGGTGNQVTGEGSVVGGGFENSVEGTHSGVSGGSRNAVHGNFAGIHGGSNNVVISNYGAVLGGFRNEVRARHSVVGGGSYNTAAGLFSVVLGQYGHATHSEALVLAFGGKNAGTCESMGPNSINVCAGSLWVNDYNLGTAFDYVVTKRRLSSDVAR
jgi:hypothetical protein